jgi:hypothetical protein
MALSGLHVACSFAGGPGWGRHPMPLLGAPAWSELLAAPGTTTNDADIGVVNSGNADLTGGVAQPVMTVRCSLDAWVAFGPAPNASTGARVFVEANVDYSFFVNPGDKLAWIAV